METWGQKRKNVFLHIIGRKSFFGGGNMFGFLLILVLCIWGLNGMFTETKDRGKDGFDVIIILVLCVIIFIIMYALFGALGN